MIRKIIILKPKRPLNFSESCNVGINNSKNNKIFIANDDIIISKNTVEELYKNTDDQTITGPDSNCNLGFQTDFAYEVEGIPLIPSMTLDQVKNIIPKIYTMPTKMDKVVSRDWLAFFAVMLTRNCVRDVGLLDETFVYDREDLDWCLRARKAGKKFSQVFSSYCFHFGGVSRKRKHKELGLKHDLDQEHNELYYQEKYGLNRKPLLAFYCFDAWEYWDENSLNSSITEKPCGIGGSETQVILLAREFSKLGYKVKIFNKCRENHFDNGYDVEYIPFQDFENYSKLVTYDYFIASRYLDCFDIPFKSRRNFAMIHDVFLIMYGRHQHDVKKDRIEKYFCLSNRHKQFVSEYHNIPMDQILMTSNGLDLGRFEGKKPRRNSKRLIYSSSPDRGLEVLLHLFDRVVEREPKAELHVYYGFENFRDQDYVKKLIGEMEKRDRVFYHGRIGQDALAQEFQKSAIWAYSTLFEETFSITALEAMAAGAVILSSEYWGLIDTVKDAGILLPMDDNRNTVFTEEYQNAWVDKCVELLSDKKEIKKWRDKGYQRVEKFTWEAVAKQWSTFFIEGHWNEIQ